MCVRVRLRAISHWKLEREELTEWSFDQCVRKEGRKEGRKEDWPTVLKVLTSIYALYS